MNARRDLGQRGEEIAAQYLVERGFDIFARNVRAQRCELDIVAVREGLVVFCEVRTRSSQALMEPVESIDRGKVQRVRRAAAAWLSTQPLRFSEIRFDAASVVWSGSQPVLSYFESAF